MMDYHVMFENFLRNGQTGRTLSLRGSVAVKASLRIAPEDRVQAALAVGDRLMLASWQGLACHSSQGEELWSLPKARGPEIVVKGDRLFYQNEDYFLNCVTLDKKEIMRNLPLTGTIGEDSRVCLFVPREQDYLIVVQIPRLGDDPPLYWIILSEFGASTCVWADKFRGMMVLPPLFWEEGHCIFVAAKEIQVFDAAAQKEGGTFALPLERVVNWSAAPDGILFILGEQENRSVLVALDSKGVVRWRWSAPEGDRWNAAQPAILGSGGEVCVLTEEAAWGVKDGKLLWKYVGDRPGFGCSLGDGTFLITSGTQLVHLDSAGNRKLSVELGETPATPPSLDDQGHVFVATESKLYRID